MSFIISSCMKEDNNNSSVSCYHASGPVSKASSTLSILDSNIPVSSHDSTTTITTVSEREELTHYNQESSPQTTKTRMPPISILV